MAKKKAAKKATKGRTPKELMALCKVLEKDDRHILARVHQDDPRLSVEPIYDFMREISKPHVKEIEDDWDTHSSSIIECIDDGGIWREADGIHRTTAKRNLGTDDLLLVQIHSVNGILGRPKNAKVTDKHTEKAGAILCKRLNIKRKPQTAIQKFRTAMSARDRIALLGNRIVEEAGCHVATSGKARHGVTCVQEILKCAGIDPARFRIALTACVKVARGGPIQRPLLRGIFHATKYAKKKRGAKREKLLTAANLKTLAEEGADTICHTINAIIRVGGTTRTVPAQVILDTINKPRNKDGSDDFVLG